VRRARPPGGHRATSAVRGTVGGAYAQVHETVNTDGVVVEDTLDCFAQDRAGNVWYFGEDTPRSTA